MPQTDPERGAVLFTVSITLVLLMVFAAFTIDVGAAYLEKRQDQTAADAGVLGAAGSLASNNATSPDQLGEVAVEVALLNLIAAPTPAEEAAWEASFATCTDPDRDMIEFPDDPALTPMIAGVETDCIHFNEAFTRIRIRIPDQTVPTTFARVIGVNNLTVSAAAEAYIYIPPGRRGIPFSVTDGEGNPHDMICIRLDTSCSGPVNDGARIIDSPLAGNPALGTTRVCGTMRSPGNGNPGADLATIGVRAANNAAVGFDHQVLIYSATGGIRTDDFGAPGPCASRSAPSLPNYVYAAQFNDLVSNWPTAAGVYMNGLADGMVYGTSFSDGGPARLKRDLGTQTRTIVQGGNHVIDDRPLWDYIDPAATNIPASCDRAGFDATYTVNDIVNCLNAFNPATHDPLFALDSNGDGIYDIEESPRAGAFPVVGSPMGSSYPPSPIESFQIGFINTMYFGSGLSPTVTYDAGDDLGNPVDVSGLNLVGMGVFRIENAMLPVSAWPLPPNTLTAEISLTR